MENQVTMSLKDYNELLKENIKLKSVVRLSKESWNDCVEVTIDLEPLQDIITEKFGCSAYAGTHKLKAIEEIYNPRVTIAAPIPVETVDEEVAAE